MSHDEPSLDLSLSTGDIVLVQDAMKKGGIPQYVVEQFGETMLRQDFEWWDRFVHFPWSEDWEDEYDHDIGSRYGIQIAIEYATPATREKLQAAVKPLDEIFKQRMKPSTFMEKRIPPPSILKGRPYFWETNAIIP